MVAGPLWQGASGKGGLALDPIHRCNGESHLRRLLQLLADGASNKKAAKELGVSLRTLELRRQKVMLKLHAKSAFQLGFLFGKHE
ncbi:response regulator FixJ [Posidoniimonas corsicana]|uniref:Response regulator FixJ n=1 Tax=Posidoniimonas corsicana TaxID=1938618 RepID=A0A5C5UZ73_9BACT|nr:response regulator FixJ [Posidoniimonas corsicana]